MASSFWLVSCRSSPPTSSRVIGRSARASLRDAAAPTARARSGAAADILAADLVPGDVVLLRTGDIVPADLRVCRADALLVDQASSPGIGARARLDRA